MGRNHKRIWRIVCAVCQHPARRLEYEEPETCSKLCAQELRRRRMWKSPRPTPAERREMTEECLSQKGELCCDVCGNALYFSSEPISGRSTWGCEPCGYLHFTDVYVGARRYPKTVTPHKRPSYHQGVA